MESRRKCVHTKVSELASRYRFSPDALYAWVRSGLIPGSCVIRVGNSIRIDSDEFDSLMRSGKLYRPRRQKAEAQARHSQEIASGSGLSEDQHTTRKERGYFRHRFLDDGETVPEAHPYSEKMIALTCPKSLK
jgi:hypothetical protein